MNKQSLNDSTIKITLLLMLIAYLFSVGVRMYWPMHFADNISMFYDGQLMINTNDGYFFASGAKDMLNGIIPQDIQRVSAYGFGLSEVTAFLANILPFSLESITLYMPSAIASLVVIPIVLVGRLMGHTLLGFFAALIGSIAWSYYNRTMVGYYDSDMFAIFLQFSIFYSFLSIAYKKDIFSVLIAIGLILVYPYFYPQGLSITYAMFIMLIVYLLLEEKNILQTKETESFSKTSISLYGSIILLSISLMMSLPIWLRIVLIIMALVLLLSNKMKEKHVLYMSIVAFISFLYFGNFFNILLVKLMGYISRGVQDEGLHFYQVIQTVREAGAIPMSTIANRISGSSIGLLLSVFGFIVLVWRHKPFIIALPLIGVGLFAYVGGLRFTVYAVPVAALSVVYLFWVLGSYLKAKPMQYAIVIVGTAAMLYPNIIHIIGYTVPTVLNKVEVDDLRKLDKISDRKDYTLTWWDYGYPIWYYSDTSTLIDGGKHQNDNYIISKIMFSTSPQQVSNLSKLAVETYVKSGYKIVADTLLDNKKETQKDANLLMEELRDSSYPLPQKTRDVYLYMPYRMMNIFPTVGVFGNLNLNTGKAERKIKFYPTSAANNNQGTIVFRNGITFDMKKGEVNIRGKNESVKYFVSTNNSKDGTTHAQSQLYNIDGDYAIVFMRSYGRFIIMDIETFQSSYVQMFILGKYDKSLFELVGSSIYSKIYKVK